jgi:hypothetical protein
MRRAPHEHQSTAKGDQTMGHRGECRPILNRPDRSCALMDFMKPGCLVHGLQSRSLRSALSTARTAAIGFDAAAVARSYILNGHSIRRPLLPVAIAQTRSPHRWSSWLDFGKTIDLLHDLKGDRHCRGPQSVGWRHLHCRVDRRLQATRDNAGSQRAPAGGHNHARCSRPGPMGAKEDGLGRDEPRRAPRR